MEGVNFILLQISDASEVRSLKILVLCSSQIFQAAAIQHHIHNNFAFFFLPLKPQSIHKKSRHNFGNAPTTSNSLLTLTQM